MYGSSSHGLVIQGSGTTNDFLFLGSDGSDSFRIANNGDISFYEDTGTTAKFFWDASAERLGIGTSSPTSAIDVRGEAVFGSGTDGVKLSYSGGNSTGIIDTGFTSTGLEFRIANTERMRIDSSGRVSIGRSSNVTAKCLELQPPAQISDFGSYILNIGGDEADDAVGTKSGIGFGYTSIAKPAAPATIGYETKNTSGGTYGDLYFATRATSGTEQPTERMRIDSSGSVGIGTSSAGTLHGVSYGTTKLHIDGGTDRGQLIIEGDSLASIVMSDNGATANSRVFLSQVNDGVLYFKSTNDNGSSKATIMSLTSAGNVGIGTSSPVNNTNRTTLGLQGAWGGQLDIMVGSTVHAQFGTDNFSSGQSCRIQSQDGIVFKSGGSAERMRIDSAGRVGIGVVPSTLWSASYDALQIGLGGSIAAHDGAGHALKIGSNFVYEGLAPNYYDKYLTTATAGKYEQDNDGHKWSTAASGTAGGVISWQERMRIDSSGNVQIKSAGKLQAFRSDNARSILVYTDNNASTVESDTDPLKIKSADRIQFETGGANERLRIDSSGNLLVGKTSSSFSVAGIGLRGTVADFTRDGNTPINVNRLNSDGALTIYHSDDTARGALSLISNDLCIHSTTSDHSGLKFANGAIHPTDHTGTPSDVARIDLGSGSYRFSDIYARNSTILTSDRNEKQDIEELSDAEQRVAVRAKGLLRKFKWKDAVAEKGDDARIHFGIIAQDLQDAFKAEGLDAGDYGVFISNTWTNKNGEQQTRMGVRYSELLAFIISAI